jgi:hypothetical protein
MSRKGGYRFSDKDMRQRKTSLARVTASSMKLICQFDESAMGAGARPILQRKAL